MHGICVMVRYNGVYDEICVMVRYNGAICTVFVLSWRDINKVGVTVLYGGVL